ncbi:MAG: YkvA family protein [Chloroflexota bacterium]
MPTTTNSAFSGAEQLMQPGMLSQAQLAWKLLRDPRVSAAKFIVPALAVIYFFSPIDLIPDFFLGIGQIDDVGIMVALAMLAIKLMPKVAPAEVVAEYRGDVRPSPQNTSASPVGEVIEGQYRVQR